MPATERAAILTGLPTSIEKRVDEIADMLTREQGKPVPDNRKEILFGAEVLRYYAGEATPDIRVRCVPHRRADIKNVVSYHPAGAAAGDRALELSRRPLLLEGRAGACGRLPARRQVAARNPVCDRHAGRLPP